MAPRGKANAEVDAAQQLPEQQAKIVKKRAPRNIQGLAEAKAAAKMTFAEWKEHQVGMDEQWPVPAYMRGQKCTTRYHDETYAVVTRWQNETRIQYRPHAKAPGTKSHVRYEAYSQATTVGEALAAGTLPADWCWDYEKGFLKVLGPVRDEPIDTSKITDESVLTDVDKAIEYWYRRELARNLGLKVTDLSVGKGCSETTPMRAHRLVAQRNAKHRLEAAENEGRSVTAEEVRLTLQEWGFAKNVTRENVRPEGQEYVFSDTMGLLRDRQGDIHLTPSTKSYPEIVQLLNKYLSDRLPAEMAGFSWTTLNLNCNYSAKLHRDGNNFGPSFLAAFGDFEGGQLNAWPEDDRHVDKLEDLKDQDKVQCDMNKGIVLFNGNCGHSVESFTGQRFSVVYFTVGCFDKAPEECKQGLRDLGMSYPKPTEDRYALLRAPRGYTALSKGDAKKDREAMPAIRFFPHEHVEAAVKPSAPTPQKKQAAAKQLTPNKQPGKRERTAAETTSSKRCRAAA